MSPKHIAAVIGSTILAVVVSACSTNSASKANNGNEAITPGVEVPATLVDDKIRKEGWTVPRAPDMVRHGMKEQKIKGEDGKEHKVVFTTYESENGFELSPEGVGAPSVMYSVFGVTGLNELSINKKIFAYTMTIYPKKDAQGGNNVPAASIFHSILDKDGDGVFETRLYGRITQIPGWAL
jgi:hypothetical protein